MTEQDKELKIEFAPGCFDSFEGSQEELNELIAELKNMFSNKSREEIEAMSRPLDEEEFNELPDEVKAQLVSFHEDEEVSDRKRTLQ
jgi:hypothetical protein